MSAMPYEETDWDGDGYAVSPEAVSRLVSPGVSPAVAPDVSWPAAPGAAPAVAPGAGEGGEDAAGGETGDGRASLDWIGTSSWTVAADGEPDGREAVPVTWPGLRLRGHLGPWPAAT